MANGDTTPSRVGLKQGVSGDTELFLKKFSGEILTTFEEKNIMKPLHTIRTISDGKSAQFPVTGVASAKYHTVGQNIADGGNSYLSDIAKSEKIISIDKVLLASSFLANIDDVMNHYDIRSVYANELGNALANRFDTAVLKTFIGAARSSANLTAGNGGDRVLTLVRISSCPIPVIPLVMTRMPLATRLVQSLLPLSSVPLRSWTKTMFLVTVVSALFAPKSTTSLLLVVQLPEST